MPDTPLMEASDAQLALAVQDNLFALFRAMAALPDAELHETPALAYHHAFPTSPMFKGVWQTRLTPDTADASIADTLAWFQARGAPYVFWWTGPGDEPTDLPDRLQAHGFAANIVGDPGMALDLDTLEQPSLPPGLTIAHATDRRTLEDWRDVFVAAYEVPPFAGQAWVDATLSLGPQVAPWQLYVGYLDGEPVATNVLFSGAGVASVYGVGTLPAARGRGVGGAITLWPLVEARARGYRYAVLFATEMGHPVYRRLGFRDVGSMIGRYLWWGG